MPDIEVRTYQQETQHNINILAGTHPCMLSVHVETSIVVAHVLAASRAIVRVGIIIIQLD